MSVCINCIICAHRESLCLRANRSVLSVLPFVPHACSALPKPPSPALWYMPNKIGYCDVWSACQLCAALRVLGLCWRSQRLGAVIVHEQQCPMLLRAGFSSEGDCGGVVSKVIWGEIRCSIRLSDCCSFLLNALSIFTDLVGFVRVVLLLPCYSSLCLAPLPFLVFPCSWGPCICFHLTAGLCSIIPVNGTWWRFVLYSETGIRLHPALFCCWNSSVCTMSSLLTPQLREKT